MHFCVYSTIPKINSLSISLFNFRSLRMLIDRRGTPTIPLNFYHVITVIIMSASNGSYANKGRGAFLSVANTHCGDMCTGKCTILKYSGTAFFAGARAESGVQEERHYISIRHSRIRYRLICHGNDSVFLRDTCNVCTACALLGRRFEIETIRPSLGTAS